MFDTMTMTKVAGGVCGTLLVFLLGKWAAETIYRGGGHHGDEEHAAYVIETDQDNGAAEEEATVDVATLIAAGDAAKGERIFGKCRACHKIDGGKASGPYLNGVVGRAIGSVDGFGYSGALNQVGETWTDENLFAFLESPRGVASGTSMGFAGLKKPEDRANLIAYLATLN